MNDLESRFCGLRRRMRLVMLLRGFSLLCLVFLGGVIAAGMLDWLVSLPAVIRAIGLVALLGFNAGVFYAAFLLPLSRKSDDLALALEVEKHYPVLNDALASTVQFLEQSPNNQAHDSEQLRKETVQRALRLSQGCDFGVVVNTRGLLWLGGGAFIVSALFVYLVLWFPADSHTGLLRLAHPFGEYDWPTDTQLKLYYPDRIAIGQTFELRGELSGKLPENAILEFKGLERQDGFVPLEIEQDADGATGTIIFRRKMQEDVKDFKFRVKANDISSPRRAGLWHSVRVAKPKFLVMLHGNPSPQTTLYWPPYTQQPSPENLEPGVWQFDAIEGTRVKMRAATDGPIAKAWVQYQAQDSGKVLAAQLAAVGYSNPLGALAIHRGTKAAYSRFPARIDSSGTRFSLFFRPWLRGYYTLRIEDAEGLPNEYSLNILLWDDPLPQVSLEVEPAGTPLAPNDSIDLHVTAADEKFALRSVYLSYYREDKDGKKLDTKPRGLLLYQHESINRAIGTSLAAFWRVPALALALPRSTHTVIDRNWSLEGLVKVGDVLVIEALAHDFNNVAAYKRPGRSGQIRLHIADEEVRVAFAEKKQIEIYNAALRLRQWQDKALKKVITAEEKIKNVPDLTPQEIDEIRALLEEAEKLQEQIHARIGQTPKKGLRKDLGQLKRMMENSKDDLRNGKERIKLLKGELDRLARDNLPEIEQRLNDVRRKLSSDKQKETDTQKNLKGDLSQAKADQKEVYQTLDDLLKHLDRWAGLQEIKGELREMLKEQEELQADTAKLKANPKTKDRMWKASLQRVAELQRRLGEKAQRLLDKMDRVAREKIISDPKMSEMLDRAAEIGRRSMLPQEMKDTNKQLQRTLPELVPLPERMQKAARKLRDKQVNIAHDQQSSSIDTLKKMIVAMQEDKEDDILRLMKKQEKAKDELDNLVDRLEKLRKKTREANQIADPEKRKKALQKLADEQRQLEQEARKKARELARLQADEAGRELRKAADQMREAVKQLEDGKNPEDNQQEALERMQQAQAQMEQAQEVAREDLAREQLDRIADQIKDLKKLQDSLIVESRRIHEQVLRVGWTRELASTLIGHSDAQRNLAGDTESMAEKVDAAKVFALILRKAGRDMSAAAEQMKQRKDKALLRVGEFPLEPELLKEENLSQAGIVLLQTRARDRLQRLIDALKMEKQKPLLAKTDDKKKKGGLQKKGGGGQQGGIQARDGIPGTAQLKALRAEQKDVNERTEAFAGANPNPMDLTPHADAELKSIRADQEALFGLFHEMLKAAAGDNQGEKK